MQRLHAWLLLEKLKKFSIQCNLKHDGMLMDYKVWYDNDIPQSFIW